MASDLQVVSDAPPAAPVISPAMTEGTGPAVADYFAVFKKRPRLIFFPALIGLLIAAVVVYLIPPRYQTSIKFKIRDPGLLQGVVGTTQTIVPHKPLLATIDADIKNKPFLEPIVRNVGLEEGFDLGDPQEAARFYTYIFKNLEVEHVDPKVGADVVSITYTGRDPQLNVAFLTKIRQAYDDYFRREYRQVVRQIYHSAETIQRESGAAVKKLEAEFTAFRASPEYGLVDLGTDLHSQQTTYTESAVQLELDIKANLAQLRVLEAQIRAQVPEDVLIGKIPNPAKQALLKQLEAAKAILNDYVVVRRWTDQTKPVMDQRKKIAAMETQVAALPDFVDAPTGTIQTNKTYQTLLDDRMKIKRELGGQQDALESIRKRLVWITEQLESIPNLSAQADEYDNQLTLEYDKLSDANRRFDRVRDAWLAIRGKGSDLFQDLDFPDSTAPPVFPSMPLFLGIGFGAGLLIGLGIAFMREFAGMTFSTANQVQGSVPLPVLGEVGRIITAEERAEVRAGRRKNVVAVGVIVLLLGALHLLYFQGLFDYLPDALVELMDAIYGM